MKVLIIVLAIIVFFVILLSVKLSVTVHYDEDITLGVNWLFIKKQLLPTDESKKKKEKKKKPKKEKKAKPDEKKDETVAPPKEKKENLFVRFYHNRGVSGVVELLKNTVNALNGMFGRIFRAFIIDDLFISLIVGDGDAAQTAIKYGKTCSVVYPLLGVITANMRVHKHRCEVLADFAQGKNIARLHAKISVVPRRLINAVIIVGVQLLFRVLLKLLKGGRAKQPAVTEQTDKTNQINVKGGN